LRHNFAVIWRHISAYSSLSFAWQKPSVRAVMAA
jgi:hypothetical protein